MSRGSIFRTETITATNNDRGIFSTIEHIFNIEVKRFTISTRLFSTIEHSDTFCCLRESGEEVFSRERAIEVNGYKTYLFAISHKVINCFADSLGNGAHSNDNTFCIFSTIVIEEVVRAAGNLRDFTHIIFHNLRNIFVIRVTSLTMLEEMVRVLSHTARNRVLRGKCTATEFSEGFLIDKVSQVLIFKHFYFLYFMRSTETVKEIDKRHSTLDSREVSDTGKVHNLLYGALCEHCEACLTASHNILMVTENTESMTC